MADPRQSEKEWEANDPVVGANTTAQDEPVASPTGITDEEKEAMANLDKDDSSQQITPTPSKLSEVIVEQPASTTSPKPTKKKWQFNPLKWNPPPVPEKRQVSREYTAGFFSKLVFQWMQPIMSVSAQPLNKLIFEFLLGFRLG